MIGSRPALAAIYLALFQLACVGAEEAASSNPNGYQVYAWQASPTSDINDNSWQHYPEAAIPEVAEKRNTAFHCSGGGTRAYTQCVGAFRALHLMEMEKPKYLLGISGGSWFTFVYSFFPMESTKDDLVMLSGIEGESFREDVGQLTIDFLERQPDQKTEMLAGPTNKLWWSVIGNLFRSLNPFDHDDWRFVFQNSLYMVFLEPFGVGKEEAFAWSINSKGNENDKENNVRQLSENRFVTKEIKDAEKNDKADTIAPTLTTLPAPTGSFPPTVLSNTTYRTVRPNHPFPMIGTTYISLEKFNHLLPSDLDERQFAINSITPLYVGLDYARQITYRDVNLLHQDENVLVGGFMEPHGYGSQGPESIDLTERYGPLSTLKSGFTTITQGAPHAFTIQRAMAHSGFAPGAWVHHEASFLGNAVIDYMNYWSPNSAPKSKPANNQYLIGDGGNTDNGDLMASIRRGVRRIVIWDNPSSPLNTREAFDPWMRAPRSDDISSDLSAYFGYFWKSSTVSYRHNHVFRQEDFPKVVNGLQVAQARGTGAVATFNLKTVENQFFGIPEGRELTVTFFHAGRCRVWEDLLPFETRQHVVPTRVNATDPQNLVQGGPFANFPFFNTFTQLDMSASQANLLSHLTTWVVMRNKEHFDFSRSPIVDEKGVIKGFESGESGEKKTENQIVDGRNPDTLSSGGPENSQHEHDKQPIFV